MNILILVPSEEYKNYAGVRIRYERLRPKLEHLGMRLEMQDVGAFHPTGSDCDVVIISKCHDGRGLVAAAAAADRGKLVGVDLFDDYFSQAADSRLTRFRNWLKQLSGSCHFALCSTPSLAELVGDYRPTLPCHVVNDPADETVTGDLDAVLRTKLNHVRDSRTVRVAWFGTGDNPHFAVGLTDLSTYGGMLCELGAGGLSVELTVLTNARALDARGLELIARMPVATTVEEWSEARERELLAEVFACFLPVNAQRFSTAKSLNRAVTALTAGCQVISAGYPLYQPLDELIYRDAATMVKDIGDCTMRLSGARLLQYQRLLGAFASADAEAASLADFLRGLGPPHVEEGAVIALVHGLVTNGAAHKLVQSVGGLSVASPYCSEPIGVDIIFRSEPGRLSMLIGDKAVQRLPAEARARLQPAEVPSGHRYWQIPATGAVAGQTMIPADRVALPAILAGYSATMRRIRSEIEAQFGPCRIIVSENSPLPLGSY